MPLRFIPFDQRAPDYRRFKDDRLAQRDIGLTAMFMVRQAVMNQIRAHDPTNDMTARRRWAMRNFSQVQSKIGRTVLLPRFWVMGNGFILPCFIS